MEQAFVVPKSWAELSNDELTTKIAILDSLLGDARHELQQRTNVFSEPQITTTVTTNAAGRAKNSSAASRPARPITYASVVQSSNPNAAPGRRFSRQIANPAIASPPDKLRETVLKHQKTRKSRVFISVHMPPNGGEDAILTQPLQQAREDIVQSLAAAGVTIDGEAAGVQHTAKLIRLRTEAQMRDGAKACFFLLQCGNEAIAAEILAQRQKIRAANGSEGRKLFVSPDLPPNMRFREAADKPFFLVFGADAPILSAERGQLRTAVQDRLRRAGLFWGPQVRFACRPKVRKEGAVVESDESVLVVMQSRDEHELVLSCSSQLAMAGFPVMGEWVLPQLPSVAMLPQSSGVVHSAADAHPLEHQLAEAFVSVTRPQRRPRRSSRRGRRSRRTSDEDGSQAAVRPPSPELWQSDDIETSVLGVDGFGASADVADDDGCAASEHKESEHDVAPAAHEASAAHSDLYFVGSAGDGSAASGTQVPAVGSDQVISSSHSQQGDVSDDSVDTSSAESDPSDSDTSDNEAMAESDAATSTEGAHRYMTRASQRRHTESA